jgi:hypothetical protein
VDLVCESLLVCIRVFFCVYWGEEIRSITIQRRIIVIINMARIIHIYLCYSVLTDLAYFALKNALQGSSSSSCPSMAKSRTLKPRLSRSTLHVRSSMAGPAVGGSSIVMYMFELGDRVITRPLHGPVRGGLYTSGRHGIFRCQCETPVSISTSIALSIGLTHLSRCRARRWAAPSSTSPPHRCVAM